MADKPLPGKRTWHKRVYRRALHQLRDRHQAEYEAILRRVRDEIPFEAADR